MNKNKEQQNKIAGILFIMAGTVSVVRLLLATIKGTWDVEHFITIFVGAIFFFAGFKMIFKK